MQHAVCRMVLAVHVSSRSRCKPGTIRPFRPDPGAASRPPGYLRRPFVPSSRPRPWSAAAT